MPISLATKERPRRHIPLKLRLAAWWEGYDAEYFVSRLNSGKSAADELAEERNFHSVFDPAEGDPNEWTSIRTQVVQDIWTPGFIAPGGVEYSADLLNGCSLEPAETMLQIGIGFGGSTRAIIERYGNYVACYDRDPALVKEAWRQAAEHRVSSKLDIELENLEKMKLKEGYFRAALLREILYTIKGKATLLEKIWDSLKAGVSQLVVTDLMFDQASTTPELQRWKEAERTPVYPYSLNELTTKMMELGFVIRIAEDESRLYRKMIIDSWKKYLSTLDTESLPPLVGQQIVHEANFWSARIAALDSGALRYVRVIGVKNS